MISSSANKTCHTPREHCRRGPRGHRPAFTLVELLVVMGMILVLISLIMPSLSAVWKGSVRTRMAADLQTLGTALEAYKQDYGDYPRPLATASFNAENSGPQLLTAALLGPGNVTTDGYDGPGWRPRAGGKVQKPY